MQTKHKLTGLTTIPANIFVRLLAVCCLSGVSTFAGSADLGVTGFTFAPLAIQRGAHPTSCTFTLANYGPNDVKSEKISYTLWLSRDKNLSADDLRLGELADSGYINAN